MENNSELKTTEELEKEEKKKEEGKKGCVILFFVIAVFVVFLFVFKPFQNISCNNNETNQTSNYGLNQTVTVRDLEYTVISVYDTKQIGSDLIGKKTDYNFVVITVKVKNNSTSEKYISGSNFYYCRGDNKYESNSAGMYLENGVILGTIGPKITKTFQIVYEIPSEHLITDYVLVSDSYQSEKIYMK